MRRVRRNARGRAGVVTTWRGQHSGCQSRQRAEPRRPIRSLVPTRPRPLRLDPSARSPGCGIDDANARCRPASKGECAESGRAPPQREQRPDRSAMPSPHRSGTTNRYARKQPPGATEPAPSSPTAPRRTPSRLAPGRGSPRGTMSRGLVDAPSHAQSELFGWATRHDGGPGLIAQRQNCGVDVRRFANRISTGPTM